LGYLQPLGLPFATALVLGLVLTPACRALARAVGYLDRPNSRKPHERPTPLLGGVAIVAAFAAAVLVQGDVRRDLLGILAGAAIVFSLGLADDQRGMHPWVKLAGQAVAAVVVINSGVRVSFLGPGLLGEAFTLVWIVGITNAFNLLDNMDGLSAGVGAISAAGFGVLASRYVELGWEQLPTAIAGAALAGACLAFLPYNLGGASIFMGDAGSMPLGLILASLAAFGNWRSPTLPTSLAIPLLILAYPIFDTALVTICRWRDGRPIAVGGTDHSSHRLVNLGLRKTEAVILIYLFAVSHALTAFLVASATLRLSLMALAMSGIILVAFGMILGRAPIAIAED
jgi:UDP-GlcNAc:undecaprenyl-phosphate/decaprenyl-phosphate GlcNAc-1-phosphate transferase